MEKKRYLGIDIGSTTFKAVLLGEDGKVERTVYKRTQPIDSGKVACTGHCSGCGACGGGGALADAGLQQEQVLTSATFISRMTQCA